MRFAALATALLVVASPALAEDELKQALETDITISFARTPLDEVVGAVREIAKLNVVVDPTFNSAATLVTAESSGGKVDAFLRQIERDHDLARSVWCGAVVLHARGKELGPEPTQGEDVEGLRRILSVNFVNATMVEAMERLKTRTGVDFFLSAKVRGYLDREVGRINLRLWSLPARHILTHLCQATGLRWTLKDGKIEFDRSGAQIAGHDATADELRVAADPNLANLSPDAEDVDKLVLDLGHAGKRNVAIKRLVRVGERAVPGVSAGLANADDDVVIACLQVLQELASKDTALDVLRVFRDGKRTLEVRTQACTTLGALGDERAIPYLIAELGNPWFKISETSRQALVRLGEPVIPHLRRRYALELRKPDGNDGIIYRSLLIFGEVGGEEATGALLRALKADRGPRAIALRHHAAIGLGFTGRKDVILPLIEALEAEEGGGIISKYINRSLNWITNAGLPPQVSQWKIWWSRNHAKLGLSDEEFEPLKPNWGDLPDLGGGSEDR